MSNNWEVGGSTQVEMGSRIACRILVTCLRGGVGLNLVTR